MISTQALKTSSTSSSKLACLYMVHVSCQKYRRIFLPKIFSDLACSQIWLHLPVNHCHFGYNTNLPKKKHLIKGLTPVSYYLKAVHHPKYSEYTILPLSLELDLI
jgi:hypothetical protein